MEIELDKDTKISVLASLQRYAREELELELSEMRAGFLFEYIQSEIAPLAYNKGVKDAEAYFRSRVEELPATCYEDALTYWMPKKK